MGQVGLHALFGLVVGEHLVAPFVPERDHRRAIMYGFVVGNIAPDLDFLAVISLYPVNRELALHLHRGFTHSLLGALAMWVGFYIASGLLKDSYMRYLGYGLSLGVIGHTVKDIFLWFTPVDVFWPLSVYGIVPPIDLWYWWVTPPLLGRLMAAAELAAFGLYYDYLIRIAVDQETDLEQISTLRRMSTICWVTWVLQTALSLDLPEAVLDMYLYLPMGLVFMPACIYLTWRMQSTIEYVGVLARVK